MARPTHGYKDAAGNKIPSVTTILGRYKDSGGLMHWAYKQGREHQSLEDRGLPSPQHLYDARDKAAASGTVAHDMIECDILGKQFVPPANASGDTLQQAQNAFIQYKEWKQQSTIKVIATEQSLVSERLGFGGTLDAIGKDGKGRIVLLDWKSSNAVYADYITQLAGYALLLKECKPQWNPAGFHILRVSKENADFAHYFFGEIDDAMELFPLLVAAYKLDAKLQRRLK